MLNLGEKELLDSISKSKKSIEELTKELEKECLAVALTMLKSGETRRADEAMKVYKKLRK